MIYDLQKASVLKRIAAGIFDLILTTVIAVGIIALLSVIFKYDSMNAELNSYYDSYALEFGIDFRKVTQDIYEKYTEAEKLHYDTVYKKLCEDLGFLKVYNLIINITILMTTFGVLIGTLIIEFVVPLILKNGQTLGKKCFGICLMHQNGVKIKTMPLLVRALLGKFTIELMIPIYVGISFVFGSISILQIFIILVLVVVQVVMIITNKYNALIHDAMSFTVVVDKESQMIFDTEDDLIKYKEQKAQEQLEETKTF